MKGQDSLKVSGRTPVRSKNMGNATNITEVKFSVGELVHHRLFDYRGVVVDVDQTCQASDGWYEAMAKSRPPRDKPWYHVLVDGSTHATYVAERNLEHDELLEPINHPMVGLFFEKFEDGKYWRKEPDN